MKRPLAVIALELAKKFALVLELAKKVALVLELEAADSNYLLPNP
jgi:hypothetical protein